ncbi:MAG: hypothetical protein JWR20_152, partial [Marmoricola sp.]|nr:hypothetical protein [Marmoricola sp.]
MAEDEDRPTGQDPAAVDVPAEEDHDATGLDLARS